MQTVVVYFLVVLAVCLELTKPWLAYCLAVLCCIRKHWVSGHMYVQMAITGDKLVSRNMTQKPTGSTTVGMLSDWTECVGRGSSETQKRHIAVSSALNILCAARSRRP